MEWIFVEWIAITLIPVITAAVIITAVCRGIARHSFKCSRCSGVFRIKWTRVLITAHSDNEYILKCPYCRKKCACIKQSEKW